MTRQHTLVVVIAVIALLTSLHVGADEGVEEATTPTVGSDAAPAKDADQAPPSADEVLRQILETRKTRPAIAPVDKPVVEAGHGGAPVGGDRLQIDSRVLGTAPGAAKPKLRREGQFIPLRRGRIVRAPGSNQVMFVFDADSRQAPEPPMFIMPCQELESIERIERIVAERGDKIVLNLAGQVFTYRGANYILPGPWNLVADKGNLR
jgi:hypothetical protein